MKFVFSVIPRDHRLPSDWDIAIAIYLAEVHLVKLEVPLARITLGTLVNINEVDTWNGRGSLPDHRTELD